MLQHWVPVLATIPEPFAAIGAAAWPVVHDTLYRGRLARLRREMTERLRLRPDLSGVGRRYNLFAGGAAIVALAMVAIAMVGVVRHDQAFGPPWMLALLPLAWSLHWAGRRVDRVHRRPHETRLR